MTMIGRSPPRRRRPPPPPRGRFRPLHVACSLRCPPEVVRHAHRRHPCHIRERDERTGRLPLSLAAASGSAVALRREGAREFLEEIICLNPSAASATDSYGRLALHLAIDSGLRWDDGVSSIIDAAPRALRTRDASTRFYPFMAAAVVGSEAEADERRRVHADLDTIYLLLRNGPELAAGMADDPPWLRTRREWEQRLEQVKNAHRQETGLLTEALNSSDSERDRLRNDLGKVTALNEVLFGENMDLRAEVDRLRLRPEGTSLAQVLNSGEQGQFDSHYDVSLCQKRQKLDLASHTT